MPARFETLVEQTLEIKSRGTDEFMCQCPFCDGATSLQFNIEKGLWVCFKCDLKGNAKTLVKKLGGIYADPEVSVDHLRNAMKRIEVEYSDEPKIKLLAESHLNRYKGDTSYWTGRGFTEKTIEKWGLGYDPLSDRAIIPYRNQEGRLIGVIQRRMGNVFPRYLYPEGFDRKHSLFGSWRISTGRLVLAEGSLDTIKINQAGFPSVAQYGSSIHPYQADLLRKMNVRSIILFYDYDEAGLKALHKSQSMLDDFLLHAVKWDTEKYCWHEKLCGCGDHDWKTIGQCRHKYACRCGRKHGMDPGELTRAQIKSMIEDAEPVGGRNATQKLQRAMQKMQGPRNGAV